MANQTPCHYCDGKGYIDIRDCVGDIQRFENCSFCGGTGFLQNETKSEDNKNNPKYVNKSNVQFE
ncbi:MAG: hypothetical protein QNJ32_13940 [Xenococcaceae cyanobacterium MO_167.B27]|nr:hypothetical protein [Xenococcaceae cyanobacterium MO_167.B27]